MLVSVPTAPPPPPPPPPYFLQDQGKVFLEVSLFLLRTRPLPERE